MDRGELVETHDMNWEEKQETIQFPLAEQPPTESQINDVLDSLGTAKEELTRLCPFPGCTLFAEHDGDHSVGEPPKEAA